MPRRQAAGSDRAAVQPQRSGGQLSNTLANEMLLTFSFIQNKKICVTDIGRFPLSERKSKKFWQKWPEKDLIAYIFPI